MRELIKAYDIVKLDPELEPEQNVRRIVLDGPDEPDKTDRSTCELWKKANVYIQVEKSIRGVEVIIGREGVRKAFVKIKEKEGNLVIEYEAEGENSHYTNILVKRIF